jgi:hypothetical protein
MDASWSAKVGGIPGGATQRTTAAPPCLAMAKFLIHSRGRFAGISGFQSPEDRLKSIAMMNPLRQKVLQVLAELSEVAPEIRFGQLLANLFYLARGLANESIWDVEDEELLEAARKHLEQWRARSGAVA